MMKKLITIFKLLLFSMILISIILFLINIYKPEKGNILIISLIDLSLIFFAIILSYIIIKTHLELRRNLIYFLLAYCFWFIGSLMWFIFEVKTIETMGSPPILHYYDIFFILFYLFLIIALYVNTKPYFFLFNKKGNLKIFFFIYLVFMFTVLLNFIGREGNFATFINAIYPILDILILTTFVPLLIGTYTLESVMGKTMLLLGMSIIFLIIADFFYYFSIFINNNTFHFDIFYNLADFGFAYSMLFLLENY